LPWQKAIPKICPGKKSGLDWLSRELPPRETPLKRLGRPLAGREYVIELDMERQSTVTPQAARLAVIEEFFARFGVITGIRHWAGIEKRPCSNSQVLLEGRRDFSEWEVPAPHGQWAGWAGLLIPRRSGNLVAGPLPLGAIPREAGRHGRRVPRRGFGRRGMKRERPSDRPSRLGSDLVTESRTGQNPRLVIAGDKSLRCQNRLPITDSRSGRNKRLKAAGNR